MPGSQFKDRSQPFWFNFADSGQEKFYWCPAGSIQIQKSTVPEWILRYAMNCKGFMPTPCGSNSPAMSSE